MTSAINPQSIDGAYPVAGQDNDSQGFRDNFTNIKTNFGYARDEINDLQSKVVLKAALTGTVLNNNMNNQVLSNLQLAQFYLSTNENLQNGAAADLTVTTSYFSTSGASTATLPAGTQAGQIKIFCASNVSAGDMVITVINPAWGGAGTITFNDNGQSCTLLYVNSKWFCIGNNGASLA